MDEQIDRAEHEEFKRRIEAENDRQNRRIDILEDTVRQNSSLTISVEKLAVNMEGMLREQEKQSQRLSALESKDGKKWQQVTGYIAASVIGALVTLFINFFAK